MTRVLVVAIGLLACAYPASAQLPPARVAVGLSVSQMRIHTVLPAVDGMPGTTEMLSAAAVGGEIGLALGRFRLRGAYRQSDLDPRTGATLEHDAAEGEIMVGVAPFSWLTIFTGAHRRTYETALGTQRWSMWEFRVRSDVPIVGDRLRAYAEVWPAVAASVNVREAWSSAWGGDGGLELVLHQAPVTLRAGYRIEVHRLEDGRREVADGVAVTVRVGVLRAR